MKYYTGIGSRNTPPEIQELMTKLATKLSEDGYILRSGAAEGADKAFEQGADAELSEIYLPWSGFNNSPGIVVEWPLASYIASTLHPAWGNLSQGAKKLMTRNVFQVLGRELKDDSEFVVCWTSDGCDSHETRTSKTGGTGLAISLASKLGIEVLNLANEDALNQIKEYID